MSDARPETPALAARLRACWREKIAVLLGLTVGICVPYAALQRVGTFPLRTLPATPFDRWIAFEPDWIVAYLSLALLVPFAPMMATRRDELARYAKGLVLLCLPAFATFFVFPVAGPRPLEAPGHALYALLISWDTPSNAFPSLHAGLAVFSLLFAQRVWVRDLSRPARAAAGIVGALWGALILYSTLATRQHWAIDLAPGVLLAWAAHTWVWRSDARDQRARSLAILNP